MTKNIYLLLLFLISFKINSQVYKNQALSPEIHTLEVMKNGEKDSYPILEYGKKDYVLISFDRISDYSSERLRYRIKFCNADWSENKQISEIEYLDGFLDNPIDDYWHSVNTTVAYTHFELAVPNKDIGIVLPGNYVVEVYDVEEEKILLHACFSALKEQVSFAYEVSSKTDIDTNKEHQQLSFDILHPNLNILDPISDIKVYVTQNNQLSTLQKLEKPNYIANNKLSYKHNRQLIFEAGNEYRRFETSSNRSNGMHIQQIEYRRPNYIAHLFTDKIRARKNYLYDEDQNGRFYIRNRESEDNDLEADYFITRFTLESDQKLNYPVFLNGYFTNNEFSDKFRMRYNVLEKEYQLELLLKQGLYNYRYLTEDGRKYTAKLTEGNYYQSENEYAIYLYHRPSGQRYDALIGFINLHSQSQ